MVICNTSATDDFTKLHNIDDISSGIVALYVFFNVFSIVFFTLSIAVGGNFFLVDEVTFLAPVNFGTFPIFDNGFLLLSLGCSFPM